MGPKLKVEVFEGKGRGVALEAIPKGSFVCEYVGKLLNFAETKAAEKAYEQQGVGCYMYYFKDDSK